MPAGDPGQQQFRRAITTFRNLHIVAGIKPLITMRQELIGNDELQDRGGMDDPTRDHLKTHLVHADRWRRRVTHNPDDQNLGKKIESAINVKGAIEDAKNPFGGDDIQNASGGLIDLPYSLDGTDPNIPLNSAIELDSPNAVILLGAIDRAIVNWTRMESRNRSRFITRFDSMRMYGEYQQILAFLDAFGGNENRVDIAQVLPGKEPLGPGDAPNLKSETSGNN